MGFQLSYAAVVSITLFVRPIYNTLYFQNRILDKIWLAICVTMAAQILTLPVVLYNFHQFPVSFLITNLLVVFLSEIILVAMLFLLLIGKWAWLATITGSIIQWLLWLMNTIVERAENVPYSLIQNIKTNVVQAWLLYGIIILLALWLLYKWPRCFLYSLYFSLAYFMIDAIDTWQANYQNKLIVYNINHHNLMDIISGRKAVCLCDTSVLNDAQANSFYIKPGRTLYRVNECENKLSAFHYNLCFMAHGKTILVLSKPLPLVSPQQRMKADIVIITGNAKLYVDDVMKSIDCPLIVADNNNSQWKIGKWKEACDSLHIRFHSIAQNGAFITDL